MYAYIIAAVVAVAMLAGSYLQGRKDGANAIRADYAARDLKAATDYAAKEREITEAARKREAEWSQRFVSASRSYQKGLANVETQRLADMAAVDARTLRLRDPGTDSQACGGGAPISAASASGHNGSEGAYLSSKAAAFLLGLTAEADSTVRQLTACQQLLIDERK